MLTCGTTTANGVALQGLTLDDGVRYYVCLRIVSATVSPGLAYDSPLAAKHRAPLLRLELDLPRHYTDPNTSRCSAEAH